MRQLCVVVIVLAAVASQSPFAAPPSKPSVGDTIQSGGVAGLNIPICDQSDNTCDPTLDWIEFPASGRYIVTAKVNVHSWASTAQVLTTCVLDDESGAYPYLDESLVSTPGASGYFAVLSLQVATPVAASGRVYLKCVHDNDGQLQTAAWGWKLIATRINNLVG